MALRKDNFWRLFSVASNTTTKLWGDEITIYGDIGDNFLFATEKNCAIKDGGGNWEGSRGNLRCRGAEYLLSRSEAQMCHSENDSVKIRDSAKYFFASASCFSISPSQATSERHASSVSNAKSHLAVVRRKIFKRWVGYGKII